MRHLTVLLIAATTVILSTTPAYADFGDQLFKLLAKDGSESDWFGYCVAISDTTAAVGAIGDDDNGNNSGSVYIFNTTTGQQHLKLLPKDGAASDFFGHSIAIGSLFGKEIAIIGATGNDDNGYASGSVYLFSIATGQQIANFMPNDGAPFDYFGSSVAISGDTVIVGASGDEDSGADAGSAYLFDITTGRELFKLLPDSGAADGRFGWSVAISGNIAIVGAFFDNENGYSSGSAYLFKTSTGCRIAKLMPDDGDEDHYFGASVAIGGTPGAEIAIVSAPGDDDNGFQSGSVYIYDATTGIQISKFLANDGSQENYFGFSVDISSRLGKQVAVIGAYGDDDDGFRSGSAYLFNISNPADPTQIAKLLAKDGATEGFFGWSVAINETTAIVGAHEDNDIGPGPNSGSAYLFDAAAPGKCPWDLDGNGSVGAADLLSLLVSWGPCPPKADCPADFDDNGSVGASDLLALLVNWGPCP